MSTNGDPEDFSFADEGLGVEQDPDDSLGGDQDMSVSIRRRSDSGDGGGGEGSADVVDDPVSCLMRFTDL